MPPSLPARGSVPAGLILVLGCALTPLTNPAWAAPHPAADAPAEPSSPDVRFPGAAVPALRGPTGFAEDPRFRAPTLTVSQASVRVELHPDLAVVEHTYTVDNAGDATRATVGLRQRGRDAPRGTAARPLAVAAWLGDRPVAAARIGVSSIGQGYGVTVEPTFPKGESVLTLRVVVQTVGAASIGNATQPASRAPSELALLAGYYALDWTADENAPTPPFAASLTLAGGLSLRGVQALEWSDGAVRHGETVYWERAPWLELRYEAPADARRASTWDEVIREADALAARPPEGHVVIPSAARPALRPGTPDVHTAIDPARARRALIVPAFGLVLLLLAGYLYRRRKEQG